MPNEIEHIEFMEPSKYSFSFGEALTLQVPRYSDASPSALVFNVETFCQDLERDVSLALLDGDGMSVGDIAELFGIKPRQVIVALEGAIQTIADKVNPLRDPDPGMYVRAADPYDVVAADPRPESGGNWRDRAECLTSDPGIFFPDEPNYSVKVAKAVCNLCMSQEECLTYAIETNQPIGVWGGLTTEERQALKRNP